jgi:hypothetical protein
MDMTIHIHPMVADIVTAMIRIIKEIVAIVMTMKISAIRIARGTIGVTGSLNLNKDHREEKTAMKGTSQEQGSLETIRVANS